MNILLKIILQYYILAQQTIQNRSILSTILTLLFLLSFSFQCQAPVPLIPCLIPYVQATDRASLPEGVDFGTAGLVRTCCTRLSRHFDFVSSCMCHTSLPSTLIFCSSSSSYLHFSHSYFSPLFSLSFLSSLTLLLQLGSLRSIFTAAIQKAFPQIITEEFGVGIITRCGNPSFGDFQCNNSLSISKYFKTLSGYSGKNISIYLLFVVFAVLIYIYHLQTFFQNSCFIFYPVLSTY